MKAQADSGGSLARLKVTAPDLWRSLISTVKRSVNDMPLWKLQTVGSERLDFLYDNLDVPTTSITLKPGVAACFRAFYGLLINQIQGAWVRFVQKLNATKLGNVTDLGIFLFDRQRASLNAYKRILIDVQRRQCFYCHKDLKRSGDVDHFIPWSRYPTDLGHNFVLAHRECNRYKSDYLAAKQHLQAWIQRNQDKAVEMAEQLRDANLPADASASARIAEWAYEQVEKANGQVWLNDTVFQRLGSTWRQLLVA